MAQPEFVPAKTADNVRERLEPATPTRWRADRPSEISSAGQPSGDRLGNQGPDQGYALKLARHYSDKLQLQSGEHLEDVISGCAAVATKRSSHFGRGPVIYDLEFAFTLWGYLGGAPDDLVTFRKKLFASVSHHYWERREVVDHVRAEVMGWTAADVRAKLHDWTVMIDANLAPSVNKRSEAMKALADVGGSEEKRAN